MQVRPDWSAAAADRAARDAASAAVLPPVTVPRPDAGGDAGRPLVPATRSGKAAWQAESGQRDWSSSSWGAADDAWGDEQAMLRKAREVLEASEASWCEAEEEGFNEHEEVAELGNDSVAQSYISEEDAQGRPSTPAEAGGDVEPCSGSHGAGGRSESEGSGEGGSMDPQADLCGAYTLSGRCTRRACNLVHGAVCPVRGSTIFRILHNYHVMQHDVRHESAALTYEQVRHRRVWCGCLRGKHDARDLLSAWRMSQAALSGCCLTVSCGLQSCGRWALHPYNAEAAARHADECAARHERLAAAARRQAHLHTQVLTKNAACPGSLAGSICSKGGCARAAPMCFVPMSAC